MSAVNLVGQVACALYEAAIAKFEAVLEAEPASRPVLRNCAFALYDLARLQPDQAARATRQLLEVCMLLTEAAATSGLFCLVHLRIAGAVQHLWAALDAGMWHAQDAARYLEDVLALDPDDQDAAAALDSCLADIEGFGVVGR